MSSAPSPSRSILPAPQAGKLDAFARAARKAVANIRPITAATSSGTTRGRRRRRRSIRCRASFSFRASACSAQVSARRTPRSRPIFAETSIAVILDVEGSSRFESISERDQFDMEYWSLEQAKLAGREVKPLEGQVAVITGGAGTIGAAIAAACGRRARRSRCSTSTRTPRRAAPQSSGLGLGCDVTDRRSVEAAFHAVAARFGGLDILVSNAGRRGRAASAKSTTTFCARVSTQFLRPSIRGASGGARHARAGTGGVLLFNASKQAVNPGVISAPTACRKRRRWP